MLFAITLLVVLPAHAQAPQPAAPAPLTTVPGTTKKQEAKPLFAPLPIPHTLVAYFSEDRFPEHFHAAIRKLKAGDLASLEPTLDKIPARSRQIEWVDGLRAFAELLSGQYDNALRLFDRALTRRASDSDLVYLKGVTLLYQQRWLDASQAFQEALWYGRQNCIPQAEMHYGKGVSLAAQAKLVPANEAFTAALNAAPPSAAAPYALTMLALANSDRGTAIRYARLAKEKNPEDLSAGALLARTLLFNADPILDRSKLTEAETLSADLLSKTKESPGTPLHREVLALRVKALLAVKKPDAAEKLIAPLARKSPEDAELQTLARQVAIEKAGAKGAQGSATPRS